MDILFELVIGIGVVGAAYYWVKTKYLKPEIPQDIDIFPSRGVPLVKRAHEQHAKEETESPKTAEPMVEELEVVADTHESIPEQAIETVMAQPFAGEPVGVTQVPEDSVLNRHYWAHLAAERQAITNPYPSDSVLRRHLESMLAATLAPIKQIKADREVELSEACNEDTVSVSCAEVEMPQDSVLRRHYQQLLESQLAGNLA